MITMVNHLKYINDKTIKLFHLDEFLAPNLIEDLKRVGERDIYGR